MLNEQKNVTKIHQKQLAKTVNNNFCLNHSNSKHNETNLNYQFRIPTKFQLLYRHNYKNLLLINNLWFFPLSRSLCVSYVFSLCRCRFMSWRCQQQLLTCNCFDHFKWYVHRFVHMTAINGGNSDDKNHRVYQIFLSVDCYSLSVFCCLVTVILIFRIA